MKYQKYNWDDLYQEYLLGKSMIDIAKMINESKVFIRLNFIKRNFLIRTRKEAHKLLRGPKTHNWKGGRSIMGHGYIQLRINGETILEHHKVYCDANDIQKIPDGYIVHHIDNNKQNNLIENLELMTKFAHKSLHSKIQMVKCNNLWGINKSKGEQDS